MISLARLPKDASGYFDITDPSIYSLPKRRDKNKPKSQRRIFEDNEGGTAVAPSPNAIPALSPVTTGTSHSTGTTGPSTPAFQNGFVDVIWCLRNAADSVQIVPLIWSTVASSTSLVKSTLSQAVGKRPLSRPPAEIGSISRSTLQRRRFQSRLSSNLTLRR